MFDCYLSSCDLLMFTHSIDIDPKVLYTCLGLGGVELKAHSDIALFQNWYCSIMSMTDS